MINRQKSFVRFTVPVLGYNNPYLSMSNYTGPLTWTWVHDSHNYMLYYPHNFIVVSALTMGIMTYDWAIDYEDRSPVSLEGFGVDPDIFDTDDVVGYCDPQCVKVNKSCGIGKYELEEFLMNVTEGKKIFKWTWLCLQSPYFVTDIVTVPNFAFPDLLYYWRFLTNLFTRRPRFGRMQSKTDFPNYYCYDKVDNCKVKELLSHYWCISTISLILWLYSPLLIHYFPSSTPKKHKRVPKNMFPSDKTPIHFGKCLKCMLCFYKHKDMPHTKLLVRLRRLLFLSLLAVASFRLLTLTPYCYYSWPLLVCAVIAVLVPSYLSEHITAEIPSKFLFWTFPRGLMQVNRHLVEYQQLAHVMQERMYLTFDARFWLFVFRTSFGRFSLLHLWTPNNTCMFLLVTVTSFHLSSIVFIAAIFINVLFYFIPLPYFYWTLLHTVFKGEYKYIQTAWKQSSMLWFAVKAACTLSHAAVMVGLVHYVLLVTYVLCYAASEFSIFTFIGGVLTATVSFPYLVQIGSLVAVIYTLVKDLHKDYDHILEEIIMILKKGETFANLSSQVHSESGNNIVLERIQLAASTSDYYRYIAVRKVRETVPYCNLLTYDGITTCLDKELYCNTVERCRPLRRQILFIVLNIVVMLFFWSVALWVKNIYHMENKVGSVFGMVQLVVIYFFPAALQLISYRSHSGKSIVLIQDVAESLHQMCTDYEEIRECLQTEEAVPIEPSSVYQPLNSSKADQPVPAPLQQVHRQFQQPQRKTKGHKKLRKHVKGLNMSIGRSPQVSCVALYCSILYTEVVFLWYVQEMAEPSEGGIISHTAADVSFHPSGILSESSYNDGNVPLLM